MLRKHKRNKMLLVLDLDKTLIYSTRYVECKEPEDDDGFFEPVKPSDFYNRGMYTYKRPYLDEFLAFCRTHFDVAVWSAASKSYVDFIVENIFGPDYPLVFVHSRDDCAVEWMDDIDILHKDINQVTHHGYTLDEIVAVDDSPFYWDKTPANLVECKPWEGEENDEDHLQAVEQFLTQVAQRNSIDGLGEFKASRDDFWVW